MRKAHHHVADLVALEHVQPQLVEHGTAAAQALEVCGRLGPVAVPHLGRQVLMCQNDVDVAPAAGRAVGGQAGTTCRREFAVLQASKAVSGSMRLMAERKCSGTVHAMQTVAGCWQHTCAMTVFSAAIVCSPGRLVSSATTSRMLTPSVETDACVAREMCAGAAGWPGSEGAAISAGRARLVWICWRSVAANPDIVRCKGMGSQRDWSDKQAAPWASAAVQ